MRMPSREAMRRLCHAVMAVAVVAALAGACTNTPDTTLHPHPPAVTYAPLEHPFRDARLFVDDQTAGARWQREHGARWLDPVTSRPQARWLNGPQDLARLPALAAHARQQRALLVLVAYYIPHRGCSSSDQGAPSSSHYRRWIGRLIHHLGSTRAAIVVEPDAVAADCFDTKRASLLKRSVKRLADAGQYVYLDAGHARWQSTGEMAQRLLTAGIQYAQGFSVNVANRQTTKQSYRWGRELSDLLGRREFVVDTSRNGLGPPPDDPDQDDEWCNPRRQGLGQTPTTRTTAPGLAALLWIKRPGESDGICGGETTYLFSPTQARRLIVNSPLVPPEDRRLAAAADVPPPRMTITERGRGGGLSPDVDRPAGDKPLTGDPPKTVRHHL
jgi:endoglucanase